MWGFYWLSWAIACLLKHHNRLTRHDRGVQPLTCDIMSCNSQSKHCKTSEDVLQKAQTISYHLAPPWYINPCIYPMGSGGHFFFLFRKVRGNIGMNENGNQRSRNVFTILIWISTRNTLADSHLLHMSVLSHSASCVKILRNEGNLPKNVTTTSKAW